MKEKTIVLCCMQGKAGEVLDRGRNHTIRRNSDFCIEAEFLNPTSETIRIRLTLSALDAHAVFRILEHGAETGLRIANAAGILESSFLIPEQSRLDLREDRTPGRTQFEKNSIDSLAEI